MNQVVAEECPICWRAFASTVVPVAIICGHSFCVECSKELRKCPICRRKLQNGYTSATNYSLLSLVNRMETMEKKDTKDQEVQTEKIKRQITPRNLSGSGSRTPSGLALTAIIKLTRIQHMLANSFKFNSNFIAQ